MFRRISVLTLSVLFAPSAAMAATFNPATSAELQTALNDAAASAEDDVINLQPGTTYSTNDNGNATFTYASTNDGSLTLSGAGMGSSILDGNSARQALNVGSSGTLANIQVSGLTVQNGAAGFAGGLQISAIGGAISLIDCEIKNSAGSFAGGAQLQNNGGGNITVRGNLITGNTGGFSNGIQVQNNDDGTILFENNVILDNNGDNGAFGGGAQLQNNGNGDVTVRDNDISGNAGDVATGIQVQNNGQGAVFFEANTVADNVNPASSNGAIQIQHNGQGQLQIVNNLIFGNSGGSTGGGLSVYDSAATASIINNTVYGNSVDGSAGVGGGIRIFADPAAGEINLFNNIVFSNTAATDSGADLLVSFDPVATAVQLFNNDFSQACFGLAAPFNCDPATVVGVTQGNNIDADPLFVDAASGNFQLSAGSPAIDSGDLNAPGLPAQDLAGNPRVVGGQVDMGAFEAQPVLVAAPAALDFGTVNVGEEGRLVLTLSNTGTGDLTVSGFTLSDGANYSVDPNGGGDPCGPTPFTIVAGGSCTIEVVFTPSSEGDFDSILEIDSDALGEVSVALSGIGQAGAIISGGGCSLGAASLGSGLFLGLLVPLSTAILLFRRRG